MGARSGSRRLCWLRRGRWPGAVDGAGDDWSGTRAGLRAPCSWPRPTAGTHSAVGARRPRPADQPLRVGRETCSSSPRTRGRWRPRSGAPAAPPLPLPHYPARRRATRRRHNPGRPCSPHSAPRTICAPSPPRGLLRAGRVQGVVASRPSPLSGLRCGGLGTETGCAADSLADRGACRVRPAGVPPHPGEDSAKRIGPRGARADRTAPAQRNE